jgi:hydrogenase large subunit
VTGRTLLVGPFNRVEGDLEIRLQVRDGRVTAAYANSPLFRGFERMLPGKDPRDALTVTPRICGICSISQSAAAARALADAAGTDPAPQGALVAQLLHGVENLADHVTHFNLFFMPDFARPAYAGRGWRGGRWRPGHWRGRSSTATRWPLLWPRRAGSRRASAAVCWKSRGCR